MISKISWLMGQDTDPYRNLALEKYLTLHAEAGECILYLWQNRHTVVIGRNQNAWEECLVRELQEDGGHLARRLSGGGAVYHDLGNLNFSFAVRREDYDTLRQSEVILRAVRRLGIRAERTGRNDLEAEGRKFSGNAFYKTRDGCCHHGTLMLDVDTEAMTKYLNVSPVKLRSKGVSSVRSRVLNLRECRPDLSVDMLAEQLKNSFGDVYGLSAEPLAVERLNTEEILRDAEDLASESWLFPPRIPFSAEAEARFPWGGIRLCLDVRGNRVAAADCWSDAMDEGMIRMIRDVLPGCRYDAEMLAEQVLGADPGDGADPETETLRSRMVSDIAGLIRQRLGRQDGETENTEN